MREIQKKHIWLAVALLIAFVYLMFVGFIHHWLFFVAAAAAMAGYYAVDRRFLRCPHCGAFINVDRLFYARWNEYHCYRCGETVHIEK